MSTISSKEKAEGHFKPIARLVRSEIENYSGIKQRVVSFAALSLALSGAFSGQSMGQTIESHYQNSHSIVKSETAGKNGTYVLPVLTKDSATGNEECYVQGVTLEGTKAVLFIQKIEGSELPKDSPYRYVCGYGDPNLTPVNMGRIDSSKEITVKSGDDIIINAAIEDKLLKISFANTKGEILLPSEESINTDRFLRPTLRHPPSRLATGVLNQPVSEEVVRETEILHIK